MGHVCCCACIFRCFSMELRALYIFHTMDISFQFLSWCVCMGVVSLCVLLAGRFLRFLFCMSVQWICIFLLFAMRFMFPQNVASSSVLFLLHGSSISCPSCFPPGVLYFRSVLVRGVHIPSSFVVPGPILLQFLFVSVWRACVHVLLRFVDFSVRIVFQMCCVSILPVSGCMWSIFVDIPRDIWRSSTLFCSSIGFCCGFI